MFPRKKYKPSPRSRLMTKADKYFSLYIRYRDTKPWMFRAGRCISCGKVVPFEKGDAGHYVNRQHMSLRYSEENVHFQCISCNRFDEGNIQDYRKSLVRMYGEEYVEKLESAKHITRKISDFELEAIAKEYKKKWEDLKSSM